MSELKNHINDAFKFLTTQTSVKPEIGIILGTGLGDLVKEIDIKNEVNYNEIPHFVTSTVESHSGKLLFGNLNGKSVVAMQGRFHFYEGYSMSEITFPVRVMKALGIHTLIISNAAGCLNPQWKKGDLMIITDHINLLGQNPLIGPNDEELGPRFPDMSEAYAKDLIKKAQHTADKLKIAVRHGVYAAMTGPSLETRAEYGMLQIIGADAIGMSTVPEVIVASHQGTKVLGFSILTDECFPETLQATSLEEIIVVASKTEPNMTKLIKEIIAEL